MKKQGLFLLAFTLLGMIIFVVQLWNYANTQRADIDEGFYAYEGLLNATGRYQLYQDYGFPPNQLPLAYLIPGYIQRWFGPDFLVGRYAAIILGILLAIGVWFTSRRLGGSWLATAILWVLALNPTLSRLYGQMTTQVVAACILIWSLFFVLGRNRSIRQIFAGSILASLVVLVRINLLPLLPLLLIYVFWQHGKKAGLWSLGAILLPIITCHIYYWPDILKVWAMWLPRSVTPFLNNWRLPSDIVSVWQPPYTTEYRFVNLIFTIRSYFVPILSVLASWILWPPRRNWVSKDDYKTSVFLSILFLVLVTIHIWGTYGRDFCIHCFETYPAFFICVPLLLLASSYKSWQVHAPKLRQVLLVVILLILVIVVAYPVGRVDVLAGGGVVEATVGNFITQEILIPILEIRIPRIENMRILDGSSPLWGVLENKLGITFFEQVQVSYRVSVLIIILSLSALAFWVVISLQKRIRIRSQCFGAKGMLISFIMMGLILSPTLVLSDYQIYDCGWEVTSSYKDVAAELAALVPSDSKVYFYAHTAMMLIYLPDIYLYPPMLYSDYFKAYGGNNDVILRYGWWNFELDRLWMVDADVALIEQRNILYYPGIVEQLLEVGFHETGQTSLSAPCHPEYFFRVFQKER